MAATNLSLSPASGHYWLYGKHAVLAALGNPRRVSRRLLVTARAQESLGTALPAHTRPKIVDVAALSALFSADAVHQGIALEVQPLAQPALEEVAALEKPLLMLDKVADPHNIGAILRSAAAFGAGGILLQDRHAPKETATIAKIAAGALEVMPMIRVTNLSRALETLQQKHFYTAIGMDGTAKHSLAEIASRYERIILVMGAEGDGLRPLVAKHCDLLAKLPIHPQMESLNVSVAAGIGLYEIIR